MNFCPGEAEALWLRRDLEAAAIPLHNVVVADRALVMKAEDAVQILGSGTLFGLAGRASEATVVVGKEIAQDRVYYGAFFKAKMEILAKRVEGR